MPTFGEWLKSARKDAGLNQTKVGALIGVTQVMVSQWERGKAEPTDDQARMLREALGEEGLGTTAPEPTPKPYPRPKAKRGRKAKPKKAAQPDDNGIDPQRCPMRLGANGHQNRYAYQLNPQTHGAYIFCLDPVAQPPEEKFSDEAE